MNTRTFRMTPLDDLSSTLPLLWVVVVGKLRPSLMDGDLALWRIWNLLPQALRFLSVPRTIGSELTDFYSPTSGTRICSVASPLAGTARAAGCCCRDTPNGRGIPAGSSL